MCTWGAVERGQVQFFDISYIEAMPRYDRKDNYTLRMELTDFSVYYTQGAADAAEAALKEGKSQVVCDKGQLYKIAKDRQGVVTRERLTRAWTDWVDYWAVDFDYQSRKEIIKVPVGSGVDGVSPSPAGGGAGENETPLDHAAAAPSLPAPLPSGEGREFEERWTGGYIFENEWQSFRTRRDRKLELMTAPHTYTRAGRYTVAVKVIDIFGNDTMILVPVNVG